MQVITWQPGTPLPSPVYVDANFLVGAVVNKHWLYGKTVALLADVLQSGSHLVVSVVALQEAYWALARISYLELNKAGTRSHFSKNLYISWCRRIFQAYPHRLSAVRDLLDGLHAAGMPLEVVPRTASELSVSESAAVGYMQAQCLTPADAHHLSLAERHAQSFVSADGDFVKVAPAVAPQLTMMHLT